MDIDDFWMGYFGKFTKAFPLPTFYTIHMGGGSIGVGAPIDLMSLNQNSSVASIPRLIYSNKTVTLIKQSIVYNLMSKCFCNIAYIDVYDLQLEFAVLKIRVGKLVSHFFKVEHYYRISLF